MSSFRFAQFSLAFWSVTVAPVMQFGCDSKSDSQTQADELFELRLDAICTKALACCDATTLTILGQKTKADCVDRGHRTADLMRQDLAVALEHKSATVNMAKARQCFARIGALTCDEWADLIAGDVPTECHGFVRGTMPLGATCKLDVSCESRSCWYDTALSAQETGTCRKTVQAGESCSADAAASCYPPLNCKMGRTNNGVTDFRCQDALAEGATCSVSGDCASDNCTSMNTCTKACNLQPYRPMLFGE